MTLVQFFQRIANLFRPTFSRMGELVSPKSLKTDILSGITVALILVPQSMAYAQLAGLPAYYGLYASFLPPIVAAIFGSSRQLATGPVAVVSLMTAATLEPLAVAGSEGFLAYATLLAFMIGLFQVLLGVFRLGVLVDFLSHPVILAFTNAGAIIIATSQLSKVFGITVEKSEHHFETIYNVLVTALSSTHWLTLIMAVLSIAIMVGLKKWRPALPNILIAVVATTLLSKLIGFAEHGGAIVGHVPSELPGFQLPILDIDIVLDLATSAVIIALIGFMEAISIAKAMAAQTRQRLDTNQELFGQGIANMVAGVFSGYPVSGSFSRSAVNIASGAKTALSSIVTGLVVGATLLFLTPLLHHLPQATLATVIILAVIRLINLKPMLQTWKAEKHDGIVAVITFIMTLLLAPHLEKGILIGVILSMGLFIYRTMRPRFVETGRYYDGRLRDIKAHPEMKSCPHIIILRFDMSLYYANAGYLENKVLEVYAENPEVSYIILDAAGIHMIDSTGKMVLVQLQQRLHDAGVNFLIARMKHQFMQSMIQTNAVNTMGIQSFFPHMDYALSYIWRNLKCEQCDNQQCPYDKKVARKEYEERTGIDLSKRDAWDHWNQENKPGF